MRQVNAIYINSVEVKHPSGEMISLDVWMNPETRKLVAINNMDLYVGKFGIPDPYEGDVMLLFARTFSGLPA
jgi:hypothetical protein